MSKLKTILFNDSIIHGVKRFALDHDHASFSAAVRALLNRALKSEYPDRRKKPTKRKAGRRKPTR